MEHIKRFDPDIEIIVITGYASLDSAIRGVRHRVFDYITKPFDVPQISDLVGRAVERRRATLRARNFRDHFLDNLSHELRTPLNAIMGFSDMLTEQLKPLLTPEHQATFERIQANSQRLLNLIESILLLNSLEVGDVQCVASTFDLRDTLDWAHRHFSNLAQEHRVTLVTDAQYHPIELRNDRPKLERLLSCLLDNAIKFNSPGGSVQVAVRAIDDERTVKIDVVDSGPGISSEDIQDLIQHASAALNPADTAEIGLGFGLRLASTLARMLGGRLSARRRTHGGSVFTLHLPRELQEGETGNV
jgi:signal transduction histidine kinase